MAPPSHIYFASDLHLGMHPREDSRKREDLFIQWLDEIKGDARELWLLGDVFDYWYEYKKVVPRGFTRFLGKLGTLVDRGLELHIFTGNHDVWLFDYLQEEIGAQVHTGTLVKEWEGKTFLLGHGDGLLKSDRGYRLLQGLFHSRTAQWFYSRIHPNGSMAFAQWWSKKSRNKKGSYVPFLGLEKEHQLIFARDYLKQATVDYFVFGHRHVPFDIAVSNSSRVICLGDWIWNFTFAVFDGKSLELKKYLKDQGSIIVEASPKQADQ